MLDLLAIMFASVAILYIVVRAARLDQTTPWFPVPVRNPKESSAGNEPTQDDARSSSWRERR